MGCLVGLKHNCLLWLLQSRITSVKTQWQKEDKITCNAFLVVSVRLPCNQYISINYAFRSQEELEEGIPLPFQCCCQEEKTAKLMGLEEMQFCSSAPNIFLLHFLYRHPYLHKHFPWHSRVCVGNAQRPLEHRISFCNGNSEKYVNIIRGLSKSFPCKAFVQM